MPQHLADGEVLDYQKRYARLSTAMLVGARSSPSITPDAPMSRPKLGEILTLDEVAERLRISKKTVYKMVRSGDLPAFKAGKH